jgi:spore coat protein CotH
MKPGAKIVRSLIALFAGLFLAAPLIVEAAANPAPKKDASWEYFNDPKIRTFHFEIAPAGLTVLQRSQRTYVKGTVREGSQVFTNVGIRLKGMGSFRPLYEKPSLAVKFDEFVEGQEYSGLTKLMFNNSVQDHTYMVEALGTQLFRDAALPAARVTHARSSVERAATSASMSSSRR